MKIFNRVVDFVVKLTSTLECIMLIRLRLEDTGKKNLSSVCFMCLDTQPTFTMKMVLLRYVNKSGLLLALSVKFV